MGNKINIWFLSSLLISMIVAIPIVTVFTSFFEPTGEYLSIVKNTFLFEYISNSIILVIGVLITTFVIGVGSAYLVSFYKFPGVNFFKWFLILSFAVPAYIYAYSLTAFFENYGTAFSIMKNLFGDGNYNTVLPKFDGMLGAIISISFSLFGYVYVLTRTSFHYQSQNLLELGKNLGFSTKKTFFNIILPSARPAIIAGLSLVAMETLSDFGAVDHFAIETFTTGIFRTWYGLYDLQTAMQLASLLLITVGIFYILEKNSRGDGIYTSSNSTFSPNKEEVLSGFRAFFAFSICLLPIFIGFILPILELSLWAFEVNIAFFNEKFFKNSINTFTLSIGTGLICAGLALVINFSLRFKPSKLIKRLSSLLSIGYAVPGLILAVGMVQLMVGLDNLIFSNLDIVLTGSIFGLLVAYIIKTYALANSSIESGYERISNSIDDSSRILGSTSWVILFNIHTPLMKTALLTSVLLVMSDVVKELPATLILRPFNFETLAVSTYIYASEERMLQAATPAIAIVLVGLIPIIFLSKMIRSSRPATKK